MIDSRNATVNGVSTARLISRSDAPKHEIVFRKRLFKAARSGSDIPSPPTTAETSYGDQSKSAVSTIDLRNGGKPAITYLYFGPNNLSVASALPASGPTDLTMHRSTNDIDTFIPVAHGPSAKQLSRMNPSSPSVARVEYWIKRRVAARSVAPRTQFVAVPLEPDDSSITASRIGRRPPWHSI